MSIVGPEPPPIVLWPMLAEHHDDIVQLVVQTFFRDEPLNRCLAFDIPTEPMEFTELILSLAAHDQCSFVAIDSSTEKIIGVILNVIKHRRPLADREHQEKLDRNEFQSEKLSYILNVLKQLHHRTDLFDEMKTDRLLHVVIVAVDPHYRGLRLTEKLIRASLDRAKNELDVQGAFSEATSLYSSKAFRKQGFHICEEVIYANYDHIRLASLTGDHDRCQLLAKVL